MKILQSFFGVAILLAGFFYAGAALAAPVTQVTSPNGGEEYNIGDTVSIEWTNADVDVATVYLIISPENVEKITMISNPSDSDSYDWEIPSSAVYVSDSLKFVVAGYQYGVGSSADKSDAVFSIKTNLTAPALSSPSDGYVVDGLAQTFNWDAVDDAVSYQIVFLSEGEADESFTVSNNYISVVTLGDLANNLSYTWKVRACMFSGSDNCSDWSTSQSFSTSVITDATLSAPSLILPAHGAVVTQSPTLSWSAVSGAAFYNYKISYASNNDALNGRIHGTVMTVKSALAPGIYKWQMRSCVARISDDTCSPWSSSREFTKRGYPSPLNLIRSAGDSKVYEVIGDRKLWISTAEVFEKTLGYGWSEVEDVSSTTAASFQTVKLLKAIGKPEVFYVTNSGFKRHIPSAAVFNSYGNDWADIFEADKKYLNIYSDIQYVKLDGGTQVYRLENGTKRPVSGAGIDWRLIAPVNSLELDTYVNAL